MTVGGVNNSQPTGPIHQPENQEKKTGFKQTLMNLFNQVKSAFSKSSELKRTENFEIKRTDAPVAQRESKTTSIAQKTGLSPKATIDEDESEEFKLEYTIGDVTTRKTLNTDDKVATSKTLKYTKLPDEKNSAYGVLPRRKIIYEQLSPDPIKSQYGQLLSDDQLPPARPPPPPPGTPPVPPRR